MNIDQYFFFFFLMYSPVEKDEKVSEKGYWLKVTIRLVWGQSVWNLTALRHLNTWLPKYSYETGWGVSAFIRLFLFFGYVYKYGRALRENKDERLYVKVLLDKLYQRFGGSVIKWVGKLLFKEIFVKKTKLKNCNNI